MPLLRRAPRHLDHLATIIETGQARARLSLFSDEHDVQVVTSLVNRVVLAVIGGVVGLMSVALLAIPGGPQVSPSTSLFDVFAYLGLFLATVLLLRTLPRRRIWRARAEAPRSKPISKVGARQEQRRRISRRYWPKGPAPGAVWAVSGMGGKWERILLRSALACFKPPPHAPF
jgi:hypothetical protein